MKRTRSDSAESAVKAMVNASKGAIPVPVHVPLRECDVPFWNGILSARARDEWTEVDLVVAQQLARCQADIERESCLLDQEDAVVRNDRGTLVVNARHAVLQQLAQREMAIMRTLRMGGVVKGETRDLVKARKIERESVKLRKELAEDELLAS